MVLKHPSKDTKDLYCEFCGFSTPSQRKLRAHIHDKHEVEKHKQCSLCDYRCPSSQKMKFHIDAKHPDQGEKQFFCDLCGKGFIYQETFKQHSRFQA